MPDRSAEDRALDAGRKPAEMLAFLGVRPGMQVMKKFGAVAKKLGREPARAAATSAGVW